MSKLSFRARALDASKPMPIYLAEELPDLPDYSAINRAVPQMPSGMEKEEESEHHLQRAISGTGLIIPTPEVYEVQDIEFYERCYPPDYKMPKQHIHMQPLWEEQEAPEYDIDSEDERWLKQQRHPELTELKFEQMMDKLEKSSGQTVVTLNEAKLLLERHDDLVIAVYDYWLNKRLSTQHPLILSVRTEARGGQSSNNPYLAFRRRTEKMQTRKNRKNDESSYEKMLKLRRDLARALTLLELVARREKAKRDLVKLTALLADRRYAAGDFASQLLPDPPPRPQYTVPIQPAAFRREQYTVQHFPPRAPPTPVDQPRQREKRPYKRRKHRHHAPGTVHALRDSGVYTSSEEESTPRTEDDGPFAFHRKPGCYYEMPTSTLSGDPVDPEDPKSDTFEHELDERYRYNLTSISHPYPKCIGFARRRVGRGGRVLLDRIRTPLDGFWPDMPLSDPKDDVQEDLEKNRYRTPKEITRDYHTSGKYPWRHAFRKHLAKEPDLWTADVKTDVKFDVKAAAEDVKMAAEDVKMAAENIKTEPMDVSPVKNNLKSDISDKCDSARTIDSVVKENLHRLMRKRAWSESSDSSYDSEDSLQPVEKEFEKFIDEVNTKWLHFRPKSPPPSPPAKFESDDHFPITPDMAITVELRPAEQPPSGHLDPFVTSEFTLNDIYPEMPNLEADHSGSSLDISNDDLISENLGLTEAQVESILSETDLKVLDEVDDKKISEDLLEELVGDGKDCFLSQSAGRASAGSKNNFGSSAVKVTQCADDEPIYIEKLQVRPPAPKPAALPGRKLGETVRRPTVTVAPAPVVTARPHTVPIERKPQIRKDETIEEIQLTHNVQLKTVQTKHSPLKKHIITSSAHRKPEAAVTVPKEGQPQIVTVAVSDSLKVRLQNHLLASQAGGNVMGLVQNGPFTALAAVPAQTTQPAAQTTPATPAATTPDHGTTSNAGVSAGGATRRVLQLSASAVHCTAPLLPASRLKLVHSRNMGQVPTVVSLAALGDGGPAPAALIKPTHQLAHLFEIKGGQLGKGPHLVNVVRGGGAAAKTSVARLEAVGDKKRQFVATFDPAQLKTVAGGFGRGQRVAVSVDGRTGVTNATGATAGQLRHTLQLRTRLQPPRHHPAKVVANLVHKTVGGVQAVALSAAQLKRLAPHHAAEIVEGGPGGVTPAAAGAGAAPGEPALDNGDSLPMEVT